MVSGGSRSAAGPPASRMSAGFAEGVGADRPIEVVDRLAHDLIRRARRRATDPDAVSRDRRLSGSRAAPEALAAPRHTTTQPLEGATCPRTSTASHSRRAPPR